MSTEAAPPTKAVNLIYMLDLLFLVLRHRANVGTHGRRYWARLFVRWPLTSSYHSSAQSVRARGHLLQESFSIHTSESRERKSLKQSVPVPPQRFSNLLKRMLISMAIGHTRRPTWNGAFRDPFGSHCRCHQLLVEEGWQIVYYPCFQFEFILHLLTKKLLQFIIRAS